MIPPVTRQQTDRSKGKPNVDTIEVDESEIDTSANRSNTMTDTDKAQEEATLAPYQKKVAFITLKLADARRSIGGHKSHLARTKDVADRAVTAMAHSGLICHTRHK